MMKRIAITGPTGAIGIALIQKCIDEGIEVLAFCRKNSKRTTRIPQSPLVKIIHCDLNEINEFSEIPIEKCDVFYHFGWAATIGSGRNDMGLQLNNVKYALDAVMLADKLGCHTFVGAGSQAEYGSFEGKLDSKVPTFPEHGYGIAKLCAGQMTRIECQKYGIKHIWARILSVYGPYDSDMTMISSTISKLMNHQKPSFTKGEQQWDYLYSVDAADAMFLLGTKGINGKIYCIGSGKAKPLAEYIGQLRDAIEPEAELGLGDIPYGEKQVMYLCADISELQEDTSFVPQVSFEEGIRNTVAWMKRGIE